MNNELKIKMYSFTIDCINPLELAEFYAKLLKWNVVFNDEEYACVAAPGTRRILSINRLYGRKSPRLNSKWHILTWPLMTWKKRFNMQ
jgi:hypothetical protein